MEFLKDIIRQGRMVGSFIQQMIQSQQSKACKEVQIHYFFTHLASSLNLQQLGQKLSSYVFWCPPEAFCQHIGIFSKLVIYFIDNLRLGTDPKNKQIELDFIRILKHKQPEISSYNLTQLNFVLGRVIKSSILIKNEHVLVNQPQYIKFYAKQNTFLHNKENQTIKITSGLIEESAKILNDLASNEIIPVNPSCLGCFPYFFQNHNLSSSCQPYFVVGYGENVSFLQDLKKSLCVTLNNGGGFIFITQNTSPYIEGIQYIPKIQQNIYQAIKASQSQLKPDHTFYQLKVEQLKVFKKISSNFSHFSNKSNIEENQKFILKLTVIPKEKRAFYIETQLNHNKISQTFCIKWNGTLAKLTQQNIYRFIVNSGQAITHRHIQKKKACPVCCVSFYDIGEFLSKNLLKSNIQQFVQQEQVKFKYKNSSILKINNSKVEESFLQKFKQFLENQKLVYELNKPFNKLEKYIRRIWFISHQCEFSILHKIKQKIDSSSNVNLIIVTRFISIRDKDQYIGIIEKMEQEVAKKFKSKPKNRNSPKSNPKFAYYQFSNEQQAIFAYIYLNNSMARSDFVKEF